MFRMQKIFWKQPIVCHRLEECYFLQNIYLGVEVADDAVAAVNINTEFPWVVKSLSILSCESLQDKTGCPP